MYIIYEQVRGCFCKSLDVESVAGFPLELVYISFLRKSSMKWDYMSEHRPTALYAHFSH